MYVDELAAGRRLGHVQTEPPDRPDGDAALNGVTRRRSVASAVDVEFRLHDDDATALLRPPELAFVELPLTLEGNQPVVVAVPGAKLVAVSALFDDLD